MDIAKVVSSRRLVRANKLAPLSFRDRTILSTGYTTIRGMPHCDEVGHARIRSLRRQPIHAEQNAIIHAAKTESR